MANLNSLSKDEIYELIRGYDYESIMHFCQTNKYVANTCKTDRKINLLVRNAERKYITSKYKSISDALSKAINSRNMSLLNKLIELGINTGINNNEAIIQASTLGNKEAVVALLGSKHVDPSAQDNKALLSAIRNNYPEIVELLLQDERTDPNEGLVLAISMNNIKMINLLLDFGADPSLSYTLPNTQQVTYPIIEASKQCLTDVVELLLRDADVDPTINNNKALFYAAIKGCYTVVELLLNDPRVNPLDNNEAALQVSLANKHYDIAKLILNRDRNSKLIPKVNQGLPLSDLIDIMLDEVEIRKELKDVIEHHDQNRFNQIMNNPISLYTIEYIIRYRLSLAIGLELTDILESPQIYSNLSNIDRELVKKALGKVNCWEPKMMILCKKFEIYPFQ